MDASAEERETRGFTSMTQYSKDSGFSANWTLQPPVIFNSDIMFSAEVRSIWYSLSPKVCEGATTMESPVCTPTGSMFSMLQTVMQLPAASRMTSYSISFQPAMQRSTSTSPTRLSLRPFVKISINSASLCAMPPPLPPRV